MSYYANPDLDNLWITSTGTDGKTWNDPIKVIKKAADTYTDGTPLRVTSGFYFVTMCAVRTYDDLILVAIEHINTKTDINDPVGFYAGPLSSGARVAQVIMNYLAVGAGQPDKSSVVFKGTRPDFI